MSAKYAWEYVAIGDPEQPTHIARFWRIDSIHHDIRLAAAQECSVRLWVRFLDAIRAKYGPDVAFKMA